MEESKKVFIARIALVLSIFVVVGIVYIIYRLADVPGMPLPQ